MSGGTCVGAVRDASGRPRLCGRPATTSRMVDGATFPMCAECAAAPPEGRLATKRERKPINASDPQALAATLTGMKELTRDIRLFAEDATLPGGERVHARVYLRKMICRRLRELDARIDALGSARNDISGSAD